MRLPWYWQHECHGLMTKEYRESEAVFSSFAAYVILLHRNRSEVSVVSIFMDGSGSWELLAPGAEYR